MPVRATDGDGTREEVIVNRVLSMSGNVARRFLPRGRTRLARFLAASAGNRSIPYRDVWGLRRVADLGDVMEAMSFVGIRPLPPNVAKLIRPGDWVVDVGANVGLVTAQLCHLVTRKGAVWAIEPLPANVARLEELKSLNDLTFLRIIEGALTSHTGKETLRLPASGGSAHPSLTKSWDTGATLQVPSWQLDDLVFESPHSRRITFLKLDVEGSEPRVMAGAGRTLREMRPLVYCEFNDILLRDAGSSSPDLLRRFRALGYECRGPLPQLKGTVVDLLLHPG